MLTVKLYRFFQKQKRLLWILILAITAVLVFFSSQLKLEDDISKFLPSDSKSSEINAALQSLKIKDKIIFNLYYEDSTLTEPETLMACADSLAEALLNTQKEYIKDLRYKVSDDLMSSTYDFFQQHLPIFLEAEDYRKIENKLHEDSVINTLAANYSTLLSPSGIVLSRYIQRDPIHLTPIGLEKIQKLQFDANFEINEGYLQTKNRKNLFLILTPAVNPTDYDVNKKFIVYLDKLIAQLKVNNPRVCIEYYGSAPVSIGNSDQIRQDTLITSLVALSLIILLLYLFFKRIRVIFYILLPVVFGALFSLTVLYFLRGEISAIAIGAGSIILGIAINFSLHFFTHFKHERSPEKVIADLSFPMLIGCATTVSAFLSLQFTKSAALHDFGLFAGFSLIGAVLFSIIVLPHLLKKNKLSAGTEEKNKASILENILTKRLDKNKTITITAFVLTIVLAYASRNVEFESDMMKMNFQSQKLSDAQQHIDDINQHSSRSVYIVSKSKNFEEALRINEKVVSKLNELRQKNLIGKFASPSEVLVSDSLQKVRIERWQQFWTSSKKDSLVNHLKVHGKKYKFKEDAFAPFLQQLTTSYSAVPLKQFDTLKMQLVADWVNESDTSVSVFAMVKADEKQKAVLFETFQNTKNVVVFDKQLVISRFVNAIVSDFNLILMITAILVFSFMLLSHGRIELAIINFLPMFVSWLWILGIMALLGLKFNIINIIISTFIFGLGDDYSIFIMDGLAHEYKYGRKNLASYKTSIILSAFTNIVGIGVLIFAEHPALKSIAAITIVGMITVLLISFIVQPALYDLLILKRKQRKLLPYTALNLSVTAIGFIVFIFGSLLLTFFGIILFTLIPAKKSWKKYIFHFMLMWVCRSMIYLFFNVKKQIINPNGETLAEPSIIISNHQSHIDLAFLLMLHPKMIVFTNDWVWNSPMYGSILRMADFYPASQGYENAIEKVKSLVKQGYSVLIFPEGTRSTTGEILRFHKGAFYLAEQLQLDIQPILLHGTGDLVTKNDFHFKEGSLTLKFLPRLKAGDLHLGSTYKDRAKNMCNLMRSELNILKQEKETVHYFRPRLIKNYIYKGPVLEWYCRVKVKMEKNYELFESHLPKKGTITDIGCGYGFLSLMLAFMSKERRITGIDYDEEKIMIASNCISRTEQVNFICEDITKVDLKSSDAFIISDVLHYLEEKEQVKLIEACIQHLNKGGTMIIRDADADKNKRHLGTRYTEFFSTNTGFNKTKQSGLHFTSATVIKNVLDNHAHLSYRIIDDTKLTSNITFLVTCKKEKTINAYS